jgi:hypothetical protein
VGGLLLVGDFHSCSKISILNYALITFWHDCAVYMYHVSCCVNDLLLNAMACLMVDSNLYILL